MGTSNNVGDIRAHEQVWQGLYDGIDRLLARFGEKGYRDGADYWIVDDDWGWDVLQVELQNLDLLRPALVKLLQAMLVGYPDWMIALRLDLRGGDGQAPGMGLLICPHHITDDLQREFLPEEFRTMRFD